MKIFKKLLSTNHIFTNIITILTVFTIGYFWIDDQYTTFESNSNEFRQIYIKYQNELTKNDINHLESDIDNILTKKQVKLKEKIKSDIIKILIILFTIMIITIIFIELWNLKLRNSFNEFTNFFKKASVENIHLSEDKVHFLEFKELTHLANDMVTSRENIETQLKEQAYKDPLTQLYNRRYFYEIFAELLQLAKRDKTALSVVMIDIDYFKNINDTYGHIIGDEVIILLSKILERVVRKSDIVARFGGEEFVIILPKSDINQSRLISEKIRSTVEEEVLKINKHEIKFTISLGVSEFDYVNNNTIEKMLKSADNALYSAKENGRNQVC